MITVKIPEGVNAKLEGSNVTVAGSKGTLIRMFVHPRVTIVLEGGEFKITPDSERKKVRAVAGTWEALLKNMFHGVKDGYTYKMKVVHVHFPMSVKVEGGKLSITNLLGQKFPKYAEIPEGVKIEVSGEDIMITGADKERVGQTAGKIEAVTRLTHRRDRRRFYDGIYLVGSE